MSVERIESPGVAAHGRSVVVWDVPAAVERGAAFRIKVGVKCVEGCEPHAWTVEVRDDAGSVLASSPVGALPWAGTSALYPAELELTAPDADGVHRWRAIAPTVAAHGPGEAAQGSHEAVAYESRADEAGHAEAEGGFNVRVVPPAECRLTVLAVDRRTGTPIERAKVVIHPYRALTDAHGAAVLRVPKGPYRLFVSGRDRFPFRRDGVASGDATIRAELETDAGPTDAELWS